MVLVSGECVMVDIRLPEGNVLVGHKATLMHPAQPSHEDLQQLHVCSTIQQLLLLSVQCNA